MVLLSAAVLSVVAPPVVGIAAIAASNCALLTASVPLTAVATLLTVLFPALIPSFVILGPIAPVLSVKDRPEPFSTVVLPAASFEVTPALLMAVLPIVTEPAVPRLIFCANLTNSVSVPSATIPILPSVNTALAAVFPFIFNVSSSLRVIVVPVSPSNLIPLVVTAVLAASAVVFTSNN